MIFGLSKEQIEAWNNYVDITKSSMAYQQFPLLYWWV